MALGMAFGAFAGLLLLTYFSESKLKLGYLNVRHLLVLGVALAICLSAGITFDADAMFLFIPVSLILKLILYVGLFALYLVIIYLFGFVDRNDLGRLASKVDKIKSRFIK